MNNIVKDMLVITATIGIAFIVSVLSIVIPMMIILSMAIIK